MSETRDLATKDALVVLKELLKDGELAFVPAALLGLTKASPRCAQIFMDVLNVSQDYSPQVRRELFIIIGSLLVDRPTS